MSIVMSDEATGAAVLASFVFLLGAIAAEPRDSFYGCLLLIASYPIYRLARRNALGVRPLAQPAVTNVEIK